MDRVEQLDLRETQGGCMIPVKAVPGSSRDRVSGVLGKDLKIAVSAPPENGKANKAIIRLLAKALGVDRRSIELVSGAANPRKEFRVSGISCVEVSDRLRVL